MLSYCKKLLTIGTVTGVLLGSANVWANEETARLNAAELLPITETIANTDSETAVVADAPDFQTFQERARQVKS